MTCHRTSALAIRTPEGVVFHQELAGPVARALAWLMDFAIILALVYAANLATQALGLVSPGLAAAFSILGGFGLFIGYGILLEWRWRGQTLGKRMLRLRVMDADGLRLRFSQVVLRNLLRFVDMLPFFYLVGGVACLFTRRAQRLGDIAANTIVVRIPRLASPDVEQLLAGKYNSLRAWPHLEARLRQRTSAAEAALAAQALLRRETLEPAARLELFRELAAQFHRKAAFPPEALEGQADEQFVRNVVDSIFRPGRREKANAPRPEPLEATP